MNAVDMSAWIGHYPFRGIPNSSIDDLRGRMTALQINRAIVSPYEAIFWENNLDAYERAAEKFQSDAQIEVWPVLRPGATVGAEKLFDRFNPLGLRLLPNYHRYRLSDPAADELMQLAKSRGMIVQIFQRIADERWHHLLTVPPVDPVDMECVSSVHADQPIVLSGIGSLAPFATRLRESPNLYADLSRIRGPQFAYEMLAKTVPMEKLVFGSLWPIQIIEASLWQIQTAKIDDTLKRRILFENAQALLDAAHDRKDQGVQS